METWYIYKESVINMYFSSKDFVFHLKDIFKTFIWHVNFFLLIFKCLLKNNTLLIIASVIITNS